MSSISTPKGQLTAREEKVDSPTYVTDAFEVLIFSKCKHTYVSRKDLLTGLYYGLAECKKNCKSIMNKYC